MPMRVRKDRVAVMLIAGIAALILTGCQSDGLQSDTSSAPTILDSIPEETKGIEVNTAYFTFWYPLEWENKVELVQTEDGNNLITTFRIEISGKDVDLFSIVLGPDEAEGFLLGTLQSEGEEAVNVYSVIEDKASEGWTEEEYNEICALQERINEITAQFYDDPRFIPNHANK